MNIAIATCCINENLYINEWVEYYKGMGFDKIFVYDNGYADGMHIKDVLSEDDTVKIFDFISRPKHHTNLTAYNDALIQCIEQGIDWLICLDADEYLMTNKQSIKDFLSQFDNAVIDTIALNWINYDDNDMLYYEPRPLNERFTRPCKNPLSFSENRHVKPFVNINNVNKKKAFYGSAHMITGKDLCVVNAVMDEIKNAYMSNTIIMDGAYIKHFRTKTICEYIDKVIKLKDYNKIDIDYNLFTLYNTDTPEKREIFNNYFTINKQTIKRQEFNKITILTCLMGNNPNYKCPLYTPLNDKYDLILITDTDTQYAGFKTVNICKTHPHLNTTIERVKYVKTHPFDFSNNELTIYMDSSCMISADPTPIIEKLNGGNKDIIWLSHPLRDNIRDEVNAWVSRTYNTSFAKALTLYKNKENDYNLITWWFAFYRRSDEVIKFLDDVYNKLFSFDGHCFRSDQLILPYMIGESNLDMSFINVQQLYNNGFLKFTGQLIENHIPIRFSPRCLKFNNKYLKILF